VGRDDLAREVGGRIVERFRDSTSVQLRYAGNDGPAGTTRTPADWARRYFVDPRPTAGEKAAVRAAFAQAGARELEATRSVYSLSAVLEESESVFYGGQTGYQLGQKVVLDVGAGLPTEARIERVTVSVTRAEGLRVVPEIGPDLDDTEGQVARAVRSLADNRRRDASDR
jgi:hypothetical protein